MKFFSAFMAVALTVLTLVCWFSYGIWAGWWYPQKYEAYLRLADDASLPETKADYLERYLIAVKEINGEPRLIFKRPDLNLELQKNILSGLIQRFRDIAKLNPSEMAYQQGMAQLTDQEMQHQLDRISGIFYAAKMRESLTRFLFFWWGWWVIPLVASGFWVLFFLIVSTE